MSDTKQQIELQIDQIDQKIAGNRNLVDDPELKELALEEIDQLSRQKTALIEVLDQLANPHSSQHLDEKNSTNLQKDAIIEIRAAAGGNEAGLFAGDLYRMYLKYATNSNWKTSQLSLSEGGLSNIREVSFEIIGSESHPAYSNLQHESGVHRVQRVPATENSGRIHTSTASVAVLPKVSPREIDIKTEDLRIDTFRAGGPGGQSVNTTDSAVRITHLPTNISVSMQDEKSQYKNKQKALEVLSSKLYQLMKQQDKDKLDDIRSDLIGSGERSEKIRTYNYPQSRVTDHRINESWHNLSEIMDGDLDKIIVALKNELEAHNQLSNS